MLELKQAWRSVGRKDRAMVPSRSLVWRVVAIACVVTASHRAPAAGRLGDDPALQIFRAGVARYVALHRELEEPLAALDARGQPLHTYVSRQILAGSIRRARAGVQQGAIFGPDVAAMFRRIVAETDHELQAWLLQRRQASLPMENVHPHVNEPYPVDDVRELPVALLRRLPPLPPDVEYRVIHLDLALWDDHAHLVVDFMPDAFGS